MKFEFNDNTSKNTGLAKGDSVFSKLFTSIFFLIFAGMGTGFFVLLVWALILGKTKWTLAFFLIIPLIFIAVGFGGLYGVWFGKQKDKSKAPKAPYGNKQLKKVGPVLFGMIFVLVGMGVFCWLSVRPYIKTQRAKSWIEMPCIILSASVGMHEGDDSTTYSIDIIYQYTFEGMDYTCDDYNFIGGSSSGYDGKKEVVDRYLTMTAPVCYVNPDKPSEAVLQRNLTAGNAYGLFGLIFVFGGLAIIVGALKKKNHGGPDWLPAIKTNKEFRDNEYTFTQQTFDPKQESIDLKPNRSQFGKFTFAIFFCLFWNGIVSIFLYQVYNGFKSGHPEWCLTLFMIPFVLVGVGSIGFIIYQFLALFNPRYTLTLRPGQLYPGTAGVITWNVRGQVNRIGTLTIKLLGKEQATYHEGTDTHTSNNTFFEMELFKTLDTPDIAVGQIGFAIPEETMHSFEAENNKIIWCINFHGDIAHWPDIKHYYKITVSPKPIE